MVEEKNENIEKSKNGKKRTKLKIFLITIAILAVLGGSTLGILLYGPYSGFREWLITTAMTTMTHQYLATWFYDDNTINAVLEKNKVIDRDDTTDETLITEITSKEDVVKEEETYANEYEKQILAKNLDKEEYHIYADEKDYRIIEISSKGYDGYLAAIYDPSRIKTVYTSKLGTSGQYLTTMAKNNNALLAVNGGGFEDPNFNSNGADPLGITYSDGKLITNKSYASSQAFIGFTKQNKLVIGRYKAQELQEMGIRDGVTFGPVLIVNGEPSKVLGNGGWGTAPRTAIGQRKDGVVLLLVVDGRTVKKPGADMNDLIEIMQNYGAYNAANLDGGTSSVMVVNNEIINDPVDSTGAHRTRFISTGFILKKEEE